MRAGAALLSAAAACGATPWHRLPGYTFEDWEREYGRTYRSAAERAERRGVFERRLAEVARHNADPASSYKRGVTAFADRTDAERRLPRGVDKHLAFRAGRGGSAPPPSLIDGTPEAIPLEKLASSVDWTKHQPPVVTPVKNQGQCGSCWVFASTENAESHWALKTGVLEELSEQFVLDCTPNPNECGGTGGCMGGIAELVYEKMKEYGGMPSEWTYPYLSGQAGAAGTCHGAPLPPQHPHSGSPMLAANVTGHVSLPANSYSAVMRAVATIGPLAVSVDAGAWHDYEEGIFDGGNHTNPDLDHLVQLVGYGTEKGKDYWLIRNSWNPTWGERGYIRLARTRGGTDCGVDVTPLDGNGCKGGPATVKVCGQNGVLFDGVYPLV